MVPPPDPASEGERPPAPIEDVLAAWRGRDLVIVLAPSPRQIGRGRERAYRLRVSGGGVTGEAVGEASSVRTWAEDLFARPDDQTAARALGPVIVPPDDASATLDVLGIGVLGKVPLAALLDGAGAPIIARRPLARVLALRPGQTAPGARDELPVVIANSRGDLFDATLEGYMVASVLGDRARLAGAYTAAPATRAALWSARRAELLHVAGHVGEQGRWSGALVLQDGDVTPDEIVQRGLAPRLAVLASCGSAAAHDEEGWGSIAAALLQAGTGAVIATDRTVEDRVSFGLMGAFYAQPDWRADPARALARVQAARARANDPRQTARAWAPFTVLRRPPG